jgi:malate synthase
MSAFTPGKSESQRDEQTKKVLEDKRREASWGHDGCWVSHPYFIGCALSAFTFDNQLHFKLSDFNKYSDLLPQGGGPYTLAGLRTNIRVGIAYLHGWNQGLGCIALDNKMEDLATLEISRAQIWQWNNYQVMLKEGIIVNQELIRQTFDQELIKLAREMEISVEDLLPAKNQAEELFLQRNLTEFMCSASEII